MTWYTRDGAIHTGRVENINERLGSAEFTYQDTCNRCGGAGGSDKWKFTGWTCFQCGGNGKGSIRVAKVYSAEKLAKLNASQAVRDAKKRVELEAAQAQAALEAVQIVADHQELIARMKATKNAFLLDLVGQMEAGKRLSERQMDAAKASLEREEAKAAAKAAAQDCPAGRVEIKGVVVSTKVVESMYGNSLKILVLDDRGFKVWGSTMLVKDFYFTPGRDGQDVRVDHERGVSKDERITFTATVEPSQDDPKFGFYKRPAKASLLEEVVA